MGLQEKSEKDLVFSWFLAGCRDKAGSGSLSDPSPFVFRLAESPRTQGLRPGGEPSLGHSSPAAPPRAPEAGAPSTLVPLRLVVSPSTSLGLILHPVLEGDLFQLPLHPGAGPQLGE